LLVAVFLVTAARLALPWSALAAILVSSVVVGVAAGQIFKSSDIGVTAAGFFTVMPLVVRNAGASVSGLPFLLVTIAWLLAVDRFHRSGRRRWLILAGGILGLGTFVNGTALLLMPAYALVSVVVLGVLHAGRRPPLRTLAVPLVVFALAAMPYLIYLLWHPGVFEDRVMAYGLYDARRFNVLQGAREVVSWVGLTARSEVYWNYFDPAFLFLSGRSLAGSLMHPDVFLLPFAVLLPLAAVRLAANPPSPAAILALAGFVLAPAAGALIARPPVPSRLVVAAPFAAILAAYGCHCWLQSERRAFRLAGGALAVAVLIAAVLFSVNVASPISQAGVLTLAQ
jgi:hypothetical protein